MADVVAVLNAGLGQADKCSSIAAMTAKLGILLSGSGSTYENLAKAIDAGQVPAEIVQVISSKPGVRGLAIAQERGHAHAVLKKPDEISACLQESGAEWIAMCGFMRYYDPPAAFKGRVLNIHPSLLPSFGGKGMYGRNVHAAVLKSGVRYSGCTVHLVDGDYDSGPILGQETVDVLGSDTVEDLEQRVQAAERRLYPRVWQELLSGGIKKNAHGASWIES